MKKQSHKKPQTPQSLLLKNGTPSSASDIQLCSVPSMAGAVPSSLRAAVCAGELSVQESWSRMGLSLLLGQGLGRGGNGCCDVKHCTLVGLGSDAAGVRGAGWSLAAPSTAGEAEAHRWPES